MAAKKGPVGKKVPARMCINISKLIKIQYLELEKIVPDVERVYSCPNIRIEIRVENVD